MKALLYTQAHALNDFALQLQEVPRPTLRPHDVLIEVKALSVNPVDVKVRSSRSDNAGVILGWDAAGVVVDAGSQTKFKVGDEVMGAGELTRQGSYAEFVAMDSRLISKKPHNLSFAEAAALPLTSLTAWEALLERKELNPSSVLIIGGAGGVGSLAIQILKIQTKATVIATASRPETVEWCQMLGADHVINHHHNLKDELKRIGVEQVDVVFSTIHSDRYVQLIPELLRPFGHLVLIDDPKSLDILSYKRKALSVHWELMFTKSLFDYHRESQGEILSKVAHLSESGKLKSTLKTVLNGLTVENLRKAHTLIEDSQSIGKIVVTV